MFNEVFDAESQKQLEEMMQAFMDPKMMESIEKLSEAASKSGLQWNMRVIHCKLLCFVIKTIIIYS